MSTISQTTFSNVFFNEKFCILIRISLRFVPKAAIDNEWVWVQVMMLGYITNVIVLNGLFS